MHVLLSLFIYTHEHSASQLLWVLNVVKLKLTASHCEHVRIYVVTIRLQHFPFKSAVYSSFWKVLFWNRWQILTRQQNGWIRWNKWIVRMQVATETILSATCSFESHRWPHISIVSTSFTQANVFRLFICKYWHKLKMKMFPARPIPTTLAGPHCIQISGLIEWSLPTLAVATVDFWWNSVNYSPINIPLALRFVWKSPTMWWTALMRYAN